MNGGLFQKSIFFRISLFGLLLAPSAFAAPKDLRLCNRILSGEVTQSVAIQKRPPKALLDPLIQRAIQLGLYDDFKYLVDLVPKQMTALEEAETTKAGSGIADEAERIRFLIDKRYEAKRELLPAPDSLTKPRVTVAGESDHKQTVDYIEATWKDLVRITPTKTASTLIPLPHPITIPGSRFQEAYYWDSFFASQALIKTGRSVLVKGQIDNFIFMIRNYGLVPNGNRSYYLSRSQPPLLTRMIRIYLESELPLTSGTIAWLRDEALPLLKKDYFRFWMDPKSRFDSETGLNHHHSPNIPRPERHSTDNEEALGKTYRDVRAEAESGKDFTAAFEGEASQYAGVLLNSILYMIESDLAYFDQLTGNLDEASKFFSAATKRKDAMKKYFRNPKDGLYYDYHLGKGRRSPILTADTFIPLYLGIIEAQEIDEYVKSALLRLESKGGILSSEVKSGKQWDAPYGWAPQIWFAVEALRKAGKVVQAERVAGKWVETVDRVFARDHAIFEKYDMVRAETPIETGSKYPTQQGFLWTNGVYLYLVNDVLKEPFIAL